MANYIKIRDLGDYSRDSAGNITGIFSGDYAALSSRPMSEGGLEPIENTRKAPIADIIKTVNLAEKEERAKDNDIDEKDFADPDVPLPPSFGKIILGKNAEGDCVIKEDPTLTARTFESIVKLGGGLNYDFEIEEGGGQDGCDALIPSITLTPANDVASTTFIVFIGKHPELDINGAPGWLSDAAGNVLTGNSTEFGSKQNANFILWEKTSAAGVLPTTYQTVQYSDNSWKTAQANGTSLTDDLTKERVMVSASGVFDYMPANDGALGTLPTDKPRITRITDQGGTPFYRQTSFRAVLNPFMSLYSAFDWCRNNFDLEKVNIKAYLRDPNLVDKNADFYTIYNALNNSAALQQVHRKYDFGSIEFYSPIVGAPRKLTQDLGVIASDGTVVSHYGGSQIQFWYGARNNASLFTNVHLAVKNISQMTNPAHFQFSRFDEGTWYANGLIIDLSDPSNANCDICCILRPYLNTTLNFNNTHSLLSRQLGLTAAQKQTRYTSPGSTRVFPDGANPTFLLGEIVQRADNKTIWECLANPSTTTEPAAGSADWAPAPISYRNNMKGRTGVRFAVEYYGISTLNVGGFIECAGSGSLIRMFFWSTDEWAFDNCPTVMGAQASMRLMTDTGMVNAGGAFVKIASGARIYWVTQICKGHTSLSVSNGPAHSFFFDSVGGAMNLAYGPSANTFMTEHQQAVPWDATVVNNSTIVNPGIATNLSAKTLNIIDQTTNQFGAPTTIEAESGSKLYSIASPMPTDNMQAGPQYSCTGTPTSVLLGQGMFGAGFPAANNPAGANHTKVFAPMNTIGTGAANDEIRGLNYELANNLWNDPKVH